MRKLLNCVIVVLCVLLCMPICVSAASNVLMTYKGIGISNKSSINNFSLNKKLKVKITHKTDSWYKVDGINTSKLYMNISVLKKGYFLYKDIDKSFNVYSTNSKTQSYSLDKGSYKLHFVASRYAANIHGKVAK